MTLTPRGALGEARWGYCSYCGRDVETRSSGRLAPHTRHSENILTNYAEMTCEGSFTNPSDRPEEKGSEDAR